MRVPIVECDLGAITSYNLRNNLRCVCPHPLEKKVESSSLSKVVMLVGTLSIVSESQLKLVQGKEWILLCQVIKVSRVAFRHICIQGLKLCA